jgi:hypothetical protein
MEKEKGSNGLWKVGREGVKVVRIKVKGLRRDERPK